SAPTTCGARKPRSRRQPSSCARRRRRSTRSASGPSARARNATRPSPVEQLAAEERALTSSEAWSSVAEVEALGGQAAAQRAAARRATAAAEQARIAERDAAERVEQLASRYAACEEQLEHARAEFSQRLARWRDTLVELPVDDDLFAAALELGHAGQPPATGL